MPLFVVVMRGADWFRDRLIIAVVCDGVMTLANVTRGAACGWQAVAGRPPHRRALIRAPSARAACQRAAWSRRASNDPCAARTLSSRTWRARPAPVCALACFVELFALADAWANGVNSESCPHRIVVSERDLHSKARSCLDARNSSTCNCNRRQEHCLFLCRAVSAIGCRVALNDRPGVVAGISTVDLRDRLRELIGGLRCLGGHNHHPGVLAGIPTVDLRDRLRELSWSLWCLVGHKVPVDRGLRARSAGRTGSTGSTDPGAKHKRDGRKSRSPRRPANETSTASCLPSEMRA